MDRCVRYIAVVYCCRWHRAAVNDVLVYGRQLLAVLLSASSTDSAIIDAIITAISSHADLRRQTYKLFMHTPGLLRFSDL